MTSGITYNFKQSDFKKQEVSKAPKTFDTAAISTVNDIGAEIK